MENNREKFRFIYEMMKFTSQEFINHYEVITEFLKTIIEFQSGMIDKTECIRRGSNLFRGHRELIVRWNEYLPHVERIDPDQHDHDENHGSSMEWTDTSLKSLDPTLQVTTNFPTAFSQEELDKNALSFMRKVTRKFRKRPRVKTDFINTLKEIHSGRIDRMEGIQRVAKLFRGHRKLIVRWNKFFPPEERIEPDGNPGPSWESRSLKPLESTPRTKKNPASSQGEVNKNALSFCDEVKYEFRNQPEVFEECLALTKELFSESERISEILQRVSNLFRDHPKLIVGFNEILSPLYRIEIEYDERMQVDDSSTLGSTGTSLTPLHTTQRTTTNSPTASSQEELDNALSIIARVKHEFEDQTEVVTDFLNTLIEFQSGRINLSEVVQLTSNLFHSHRELFVQWNKYLPPEERIDLSACELENVSNPGSSLESTATSLKAMLSTLQTMVNPLTAYSQELDRAQSCIAQVKHEFISQTEVVTDFIITLKEFQSGRIHQSEVIQRMPNLFLSHHELIVPWNKYLPPEERIDPDQHENVSYPGSYLESTDTSLEPLVSTLQTTFNAPTVSSQLLEDAQFYIARVQSKLINQPEVFEELRDLTKRLFPASEKTPEILRRVSDLLRGHPELIAGYNVFLPPCYKIEEHGEKEQVDDGSSAIESTRTSLTPLRTAQETSANPLTAPLTAAAESPAENRKPPQLLNFNYRKSLKTYGRLRF